MGLPPRWRRLALVGLVPAALAAVPLAMRGASQPHARELHAGAPAGTVELAAPAFPDAAPAAAPAACAGPAPQPQRAAFEERVVELVNEQRMAAGLPPLKRVEPLTSSARWFAHDMARDDYFAEDHDTYRREGGRLVHTCEWSARLGWFYPGWTSLAENIAAGYGSPEEVVAGWLASPNHRAKMLGHGHWETGAGYWAGGSEGHYWVQDFGRRNGVFPAVIDGEARRTRSPRVAVFVYGSWREMRVRNDDDAFGPWRTFTSSFEWTLREGAGPRRVTVELRDGRRRAAASDTIELAPAQPPT